MNVVSNMRRTSDYQSSCRTEQGNFDHSLTDMVDGHQNSQKQSHKRLSPRHGKLSRNGHCDKNVVEENISSQHLTVSVSDSVSNKIKEPHHALSQSKDPLRGFQRRGEEMPSSKDEAVISSTDNISSVNRAATYSQSRGTDNLKQVWLLPDHKNLTGNESSGLELCLKLFGIAVVEYSNSKAKWDHMNTSRKLVVRAVSEGSAASSSGCVHRGDMLVLINNTEVSWLNFTRLMNSVNSRKKVKFTLQSPRIVGPQMTCSVLEVPDKDLCLSVTGRPALEVQAELCSLGCVVLYLTLVKSDSDGHEDIVYRFPPDEQSLTDLRGLFMTLSSSLLDVVGQPASSTTLELNGSIVNLVYQQLGKDVFLLAAPHSRMSVSALTYCFTSLSALMILLFSDIKSACSDGDRLWLDRLLTVMLYQALELHPVSLCRQMKDYQSVAALSLFHENELICDEILSEFEAMDFDNYLDAKDLFLRRQHRILGASLFYKDYLLCSHLSSQQQREVNLFLNCHGLLLLSPRQHVDDVLVWQELQPSLTAEACLSLPPGYRPSPARIFLLVVGLHHYYLAIIVEAGAGGHLSSQVRPPPLLVEQGKATLAQLEMEEVHMSQCCEERLMNITKGVSLASVDDLCTLTSARMVAPAGLELGSKFSGHQNNCHGSHSLVQSKSFRSNSLTRSKSADRFEDRIEAGHMRRHGSKLSYGSSESAGSGSSLGLSKGRASRVSSTADLSSILRSMPSLLIDIPHDIVRESRLDRGKKATLFTYLFLDSTEGILIAPTEAELLEAHSLLQQEVLENFSKTCQGIKALFKDKASKSNAPSALSLFGTHPEDEEEFQEMGALFSCVFQSSQEKKRGVLVLNYWVVGRRWSSPRCQEMYVCFHESVQQSLVEMAFSLNFGL